MSSRDEVMVSRLPNDADWRKAAFTKNTNFHYSSNHDDIESLRSEESKNFKKELLDVIKTRFSKYSDVTFLVGEGEGMKDKSSESSHSADIDYFDRLGQDTESNKLRKHFTKSVETIPANVDGHEDEIVERSDEIVTWDMPARHSYNIFKDKPLTVEDTARSESRLQLIKDEYPYTELLVERIKKLSEEVRLTKSVLNFWAERPITTTDLDVICGMTDEIYGSFRILDKNTDSLMSVDQDLNAHFYGETKVSLHEKKMTPHKESMQHMMCCSKVYKGSIPLFTLDTAEAAENAAGCVANERLNLLENQIDGLEKTLGLDCKQSDNSTADKPLKMIDKLNSIYESISLMTNDDRLKKFTTKLSVLEAERDRLTGKGVPVDDLVNVMPEEWKVENRMMSLRNMMRDCANLQRESQLIPDMLREMINSDDFKEFLNLLKLLKNQELQNSKVERFCTQSAASIAGMMKSFDCFKLKK